MNNQVYRTTENEQTSIPRCIPEPPLQEVMKNYQSLKTAAKLSSGTHIVIYFILFLILAVLLFQKDPLQSIQSFIASVSTYPTISFLLIIIGCFIIFFDFGMAVVPLTYN